MFSPNSAYTFSKYVDGNSGELKRGNIVVVVAVDSESQKLLVVKNGTDYVQQVSPDELKPNEVSVPASVLEKAAEVYAVHKSTSQLPQNYDLDLSNVMTIEDEGSITQSLVNLLTYNKASGESVTNNLIVTEELNKLKDGRTWTQVGLELVKRADVTKFQLGGVLLNALSEGEHVRAGFSSVMSGFMEWVETTFDFKSAKAYQLMKIYHRLTNLGVSEDKISDMGFRKLYMLCNYMDEGNCDELLALAKTLNEQALKDELGRIFNEDGSRNEDVESFDDTVKVVQNVKFTNYNIKFAQDELPILEDVLHKYSVDNPDIALSEKNPLRQVFLAMAVNYLDSTSPMDVLNQSPEKLIQYLNAIHPNVVWSAQDAGSVVRDASDVLELDDYA